MASRERDPKSRSPPARPGPFPKKQESRQKAGMKKKRSDPLEPKVYLPSRSHQDYQNQEWEYFEEHHGEKLVKKGRLKYRSIPGLDDRKVTASFYQHQIEQAKIISDEVDRYVIEAVNLFAEHLIELTVSLTPFRFSTEAQGLGAAVCRVLGGLRLQALKGNYDMGRKAKTRLEKIVKGILPDTRGKKSRTADPLQVQKFYWGELFRLYHVRHTLQSPKGVRNFSAKVKAASKNFEMPIELIRELWGLDEDDMPDRQAFSLKDMARELTARHFKITHQTIQNILAS